jgi:cobalt-zinc-cadmium efflux system outer membrane protein
LQAARVAESLAEAQIQLARSTGRFDASLTGKYELMNFGFPQRGFDDAGRLVPINGRFHSVAVGVTLNLPVRNKNQGAIEAAVAEKEAATRRREFAELTVKREVAASFARYAQATRAAEIYRVGVRDQASANLAVVRQTYELGSKTLLDYIAEQRRFIEVETAFIDSLLETYLARVEIQRAASSPELIKK